MMYKVIKETLMVFLLLLSCGTLSRAADAGKPRPWSLINIDLTGAGFNSHGVSGHAVGAGVVGEPGDIWIQTGPIAENLTPGKPVVVTNLKDATGHATTVTFAADFERSYGGPAPTWTNAPEGAGAKLSQGISYIRKGSRQSVFSGLPAGARFNVYLIDFTLSDGRATDFTINGVTQTVKTPNVYAPTWTAGEHYVLFKDVAADAEGTITIGVAIHPGGGEASLSGIQLQAVGGAGPAESAPVAVTTAPAAPADPLAFLKLAPTPPMGWNSYDCFGISVTEEEVLANAAYLKDKLLAHGWNYVVIDARWADPDAANHDGARVDMLVDEFGRLVPDPKRFPSVGDGRSFKPLADKIHAMGLKFGIHVQRGIPKRSVEANTPIEGSTFHAIDAANTQSTCSWCADMYGVDGGSPAGKAWYNSLFRQYANWGVDFVKVDDISFPYYPGEVDAIRRAIDSSGRPMVLSLSPGQADLNAAELLKTQANTWRIKDDFWDNWSDLKDMFRLLDAWTIGRGEGHWPDADMLPLGSIGVRFLNIKPRQTVFTRDEQTLLMSLWCIARSPLMFGGNLPQNDAFTLSLLNNDEVLAVNQRSSGNRQLSSKDGVVVWVADVRDSTAKYVAVFNLNDAAKADVTVAFTELGLTGPCAVRDLWQRTDLGIVKDRFSTPLPAHGAVLVRIGNATK